MKAAMKQGIYSINHSNQLSYCNIHEATLANVEELRYYVAQRLAKGEANLKDDLGRTPLHVSKVNLVSNRIGPCSYW
jgi:hypothetical protein